MGGCVLPSAERRIYLIKRKMLTSSHEYEVSAGGKKGYYKIVKCFQSYWQVYLFLLLPLAYILVYNYYPMLGLQIAFKDYNARDGIWGSTFVGFKYFNKFFQSYQFITVLKNTVVLSFYTIAATFPLPIIFALLLNSVQKKRFNKFVQTVTYMPHFISIVVLVGIMMQIFNAKSGIYGTVYQFITGNYPADLFGSASKFPHLYVWSEVWQSFGWGSIVYLAALTSISPELHEAAEIDGANRFQRILHVDLPGILPTATVMLILRAGQVMSLGFEKVYLMQNSLNISSSEIISTYVYKIAMGIDSLPNYSYSTAIGLFNSVVNLFLIVCVNSICKKLSDTSLW